MIEIAQPMQNAQDNFPQPLSDPAKMQFLTSHYTIIYNININILYYTIIDIRPIESYPKTYYPLWRYKNNTLF